ncbi:hypothetical protein FRAHR75_1040022 [Frankia sp. Hr75.2]|nr:hypothetical protein FRAHR75_1040022 [Frankia sp. Hr75.2]
MRHAGFRSVTARIPLTSVEHGIVNDDIEKRRPDGLLARACRAWRVRSAPGSRRAGGDQVLSPRPP